MLAKLSYISEVFGEREWFLLKSDFCFRKKTTEPEAKITNDRQSSATKRAGLPESDFCFPLSGRMEERKIVRREFWLFVPSIRSFDQGTKNKMFECRRTTFDPQSKERMAKKTTEPKGK